MCADQIIPFEDYTYTGVPVINGRGFAIHIHNEEETKNFFEELAKQQDELSTEFFQKWITFETYRKIIFQ